MIKSPNKYTSLDRLKQIKKDNFVGETGQEYCPFELEALMAFKEQDQAMQFSSRARKTVELLDRNKLVNEKILNQLSSKTLKDIINEDIAELRLNGHRYLNIAAIERAAELRFNNYKLKAV